MEEDFMEIGNTGLVPLSDGKFLNKDTNEILDAEGEVVGEYSQSDIEEGTEELPGRTN